MAQSEMPRVIDRSFLELLDTLDLYIKRSMQGLLGGKRKSTRRGSSLEWLENSEYIPGDDLKKIDWNLAARTDLLFTKHFADERRLKTRIYLDTSASMGIGDGGRKGVIVRQLAAALGYISIRNMDLTEFCILHGNQCTSLCGMVTNEDTFLHAANLLEDISFNDNTDLYRAIHADAGFERHHGVVILISDLLTDSMWQRLVDELLARGQEVILVQVLAPEELDPTLHGALSLADAELPLDHGRFNITMGRRELAAYQAAREAWQKEIIQFCHGRDVSLLSVCSSDSIETILLNKGFETGVIQ